MAKLPCAKSRRDSSVFENKKEPAASYSRTGESRTTLGDGALDFRVRNGNGYDNSSMATGKTDFASRNQMHISNLKSQISSGDLRCLDVIQDVLRSDPHDCKASWELKRITTRHEMRGMISHSSEVQKCGRFGRFGRSMELSKASKHPDFPNLRFRRKRIS